MNDDASTPRVLDSWVTPRFAQAFYADLHARGIVPISAGGDHTVPLPVIRAIGSTERPFACLHFDADGHTGVNAANLLFEIPCLAAEGWTARRNDG